MAACAPSPFTAIADQISRRLGRSFVIEQANAIGGGCINEGWGIRGAGLRFFLKLNRSERLVMFEAEREGLQALAAAQAVRVPEPVCAGADGEHAWLVLEYLELGGTPDWARLGERLALLHRMTAPTFGWHRDNTIGSTRQPNQPAAQWIEFFRRARLGFQLQLAIDNGYGAPLGERGSRLLELLGAFFPGDHPAPSLLHGDLWSGNVGFDVNGVPAAFDPATYYGDREADLAMTELFGGFGPRFYAAYREAWPLDAGYATRKRLYNLYHLLNHLNLFGSSYLARCSSEIDWLLGET